MQRGLNVQHRLRRPIAVPISMVWLTEATMGNDSGETAMTWFETS